MISIDGYEDFADPSLVFRSYSHTGNVAISQVSISMLLDDMKMPLDDSSSTQNFDEESLQDIPPTQLIPQVWTQDALEIALLCAAKRGEEKRIAELLNKGPISIYIRGLILEIVAKKGYLEIVQELIKEPIRWTNLEEAVVKASASGHDQIVKVLLKHELFKKEGAHKIVLGRAIVKAAENGKQEVVSLLLEDPSIEDEDIGSALYYAAYKGHSAVVKTLLASLEKIVETILGSAVEAATLINNVLIVRMLINKGPIPLENRERAVRFARENFLLDILPILAKGFPEILEKIEREIFEKNFKLLGF